jgi:ankyrin repeat protein
MGQRLSKEATLLAPSIAGDLDEVKRLVGQFIGATKNNDGSALREFVNRSDAAGNCAIHGAVFAGHLEIASFLAESCGADLTIKNGMGCSPIWISSGYNHTKCLEYLVQQLSTNKDSKRCLERYLLYENDAGDSPFLAAASKGNIQVCKFMLTIIDGDDFKCRLIRTPNKAGDTPLKVAVAGCHDIELLELILEADASISNINSGSSQDEMCINKKNNLGLSPLIIACERNLPLVVELLIKHGADVNIRDSKGRHLLAVSAFCGCDDVVKFLLSQMKQSLSIAYLLNEKDDAGCTALWLAARTGNLKMVELLIDAGADESIADDEGLAPQNVAVKFKKEKVEKYFQGRQIKK